MRFETEDEFVEYMSIQLYQRLRDPSLYVDYGYQSWHAASGEVTFQVAGVRGFTQCREVLHRDLGRVQLATLDMPQARVFKMGGREELLQLHESYTTPLALFGDEPRLTYVDMTASQTRKDHEMDARVENVLLDLGWETQEGFREKQWGKYWTKDELSLSVFVFYNPDILPLHIMSADTHRFDHDTQVVRERLAKWRRGLECYETLRRTGWGGTE